MTPSAWRSGWPSACTLSPPSYGFGGGRPELGPNYPFLSQARLTLAIVTVELELPRLETLSPSRAGDFKTCPQLFKFRAIDRLPEPTSIYQARGTTAHLALQRLFDHPSTERSPERLYDLFREAWTELRGSEEFDELFANTDEERQWGVESLELLANYFSIEDPTGFDPVDRELDMLEDLDGITIRGILDRIDRDDDGRLVITDYKTGKAPPERFALPAFFALKIYALLIRRGTGETPKELRLLYLNGPTLYRLDIDDRQLDAMDSQLRALWNAIDRALATQTFPTRPGTLCNWCSFQEICPAFIEVG
jgi:putative RecB family exonuclease